MSDPLKPFACNIKVQPVAKWLEEETDDEEDCRTCLIAPLATYYAGTLEEYGQSELLGSLEKKWESGDPLTIAKELDRIKNEVGDDLKKYLKSLDCLTQTFKE